MLSVSLFLAGCATVRPVDVTIVSAAIGPSTATLEAWDGLGKVPADVRDRAIADANEIDPLVGLAVSSVARFNDLVSPPDPAGSVFVVAPTAGAPVALPVQEDTFTPGWNTTLPGVPLGADTRVRVTVVDDDTKFDEADAVGSVDLDAAALRRALAARQPYTFDYAEVTGGQLLALTVVVSPAK